MMLVLLIPFAGWVAEKLYAGDQILGLIPRFGPEIKRWRSRKWRTVEASFGIVKKKVSQILQLMTASVASLTSKGKKIVTVAGNTGRFSIG